MFIYFEREGGCIQYNVAQNLTRPSTVSSGNVVSAFCFCEAGKRVFFLTFIPSILQCQRVQKILSKIHDGSKWAIYV